MAAGRRCSRKRVRSSPLTLCIDIGGTHLKAAIVGPNGAMASERLEMETPHPAPPNRFFEAIEELTKNLRHYARVSAGFPGAIRDGIVLTAPNLGTEAWRGIDLTRELSRRLQRPVRILNDSEVQGLEAIRGKGLECVLTLGTGIGSALFRDGELMPHLELGQHPAWKKMTYDQYLGHAAFLAKGRKTWNRRLERMLGFVTTLLNYDTLYLGGGNAKKIAFKLPERIKVVSNELGITGGIRLWEARFDPIFAASDRRQASGRG
jgi:polyphosphate glucokinase